MSPEVNGKGHFCASYQISVNTRKVISRQNKKEENDDNFDDDDNADDADNDNDDVLYLYCIYYLHLAWPL